MIALLQRVTRAEVRVHQRQVGAIDAGVLALIGVRGADAPADVHRLLERVLAWRMFDATDAQGRRRMNLSLAATGGGLLLVPQFTLAADTASGTRASFSAAAPPQQARELFELLVEAARSVHAGPVATGEFGADMEVSLANDGPVTFWLET